IFLKRPRRFQLEDARSFLPAIDAVTRQAMDKAEPIVTMINNPKDLQDKKLLTLRLQSIVEKWSSQMLYFGVMTRGLWMVDFDCGHGYYSWVAGEKDITTYRSYTQDFDQRTPLI